MISDQVKKTAVYFRGVAHYPVNVCMHCGAEDDPEGYWAEDEDGDRICRTCERELVDEREILADIDEVVFGLEHPKLVSIFEYRLEKSVELNRQRKVSRP